MLRTGIPWMTLVKVEWRCADSCVEMLYHSARVKMLCRPATNEQAGSFIILLERAARKGEFASAQTVFLLLYDNVLHPANADRLFGRALESRLGLEPANGLVQVNDGGVWEWHAEQRTCLCSTCRIHTSPPTLQVAANPA